MKTIRGGLFPWIISCTFLVSARLPAGDLPVDLLLSFIIGVGVLDSRQLILVSQEFRGAQLQILLLFDLPRLQIFPKSAAVWVIRNALLQHVLQRPA